MEDRYWPFPVLPPGQQTPPHKQQVCFVEAAYNEGFRPLVLGSDNYQATAADRGGTILARTRQFWEVSVGTPDGSSFRPTWTASPSRVRPSSAGCEAGDCRTSWSSPGLTWSKSLPDPPGTDSARQQI